MVIPDALKVLRLQHGHRYCQLVRALGASLGRGAGLGWAGEAAGGREAWLQLGRPARRRA